MCRILQDNNDNIYVTISDKPDEPDKAEYEPDRTIRFYKKN